MENTQTKEVKLEFNVIATLVLIGSDDSLMTMFTQKHSGDIKMHIATAKNDLLKPEMVDFIKGMFDNIVLKRKEYVDSYKLALNKQPLVKEDKPKTLPVRYGKVQLLKDIEAQGTPMTEQQRMLLKLNDLKNIYSKLHRKAIANVLGDAETLSDKDCRDVIATIVQVENRHKDVL